MSTVPNPVTAPASRLVRAADDYLNDIQIQLAVWYGRVGSAPNASGHHAVRDIDNAIRALGYARRQLVTELGNYERETAARTDALLATCRAERGGR